MRRNGLAGLPGRHADFETHQGDHASVEPDRSQPSTGSHTLAEPTEAAGSSRANPANDLPDATTSQPHRPVPTYKSAVHHSVALQVRPAGRLTEHQHAARPCGCGCPKPCRGWSGGSSVFVDESATACRSDDSKLLLSIGVWRFGRRWGSLIERAVGPVGVVVVDVVGDEVFELALVPDDGAVKKLSSQGADPTFGERVSHWDANRVGAQNSVVGTDQGFRAPSGDQESVRDSVHEDSASAPIAAGQRPRQSFRHPHG